MLDPRPLLADTYLNPVYTKSFPDPFVIKFAGEYFAYCTGFAIEGLVFGVLRSSDLVNWTAAGGAMSPLENSPPYYWAPEVVYSNGRFYLYYSVGNETLMEIRVAVSDRPDGGFVDAGKRLTFEEFAIDAHVFTDDDGSRYMFYATDFLEHTHIGTGVVVDRMIDWYTLEGKPRPVTRAKYDWQVYDPQRKEKGGVRWHTVEGPTVLKRKGLYYEMFSGGNWQNTTYGVSFAVTGDIRQPDEWLQFSDGKDVLPILRTIPDKVIGPGHNSVVRGPNNRELYCIYHRWLGNERVMAIDRMDLAGRRIFITGASDTPQPAPFRPRIYERFRRDPAANAVSLHGEWQFTGQDGVRSTASGCEVRIADAGPSFLLELTWKVVDRSARFAIRLTDSAEIQFDTGQNAVLAVLDGDVRRLSLPKDFDWSAAHLARIDVDHHRVSVEIDDHSLRLRTRMPALAGPPAISVEEGSLALISLELTEGFEELFDDADPLLNNAWTFTPDGRYRVAAGELVLDSEGRYLLQKGRPMCSIESAVNIRTLDSQPVGGGYGLVMRLEDGSEAGRFTIDVASMTANFSTESLPLPPNIDLSEYHQMRIVKIVGHAIIYLDETVIGEIPVTDKPVTCAVIVEGVRAVIEMIRLTAL